jgi:hypothetical protein
MIPLHIDGETRRVERHPETLWLAEHRLTLRKRRGAGDAALAAWGTSMRSLRTAPDRRETGAERVPAAQRMA